MPNRDMVERGKQPQHVICGFSPYVAFDHAVAFRTVALMAVAVA